MRNTILVGIILTLLSVYFVKQSFNNAKYSNLVPHNAHISALILARGGSKGIPLKNLSLIQNKTLLSISINTINKFGLFDSIWVSTDNEKIAQEAKNFGANIHWRQSYTATDEASSLIAVKEFIHKHPETIIIALIQCTSPFLKPKYLKQAYDKIQQGYHSVFSVTRQHKLRWKITDGIAKAENFDIFNRPRRQDWEGEIYENGMFYITYTDIVINEDILQGGKSSIVEISYNDSLEIDTIYDLKFAQILYNFLLVKNH